MTAIHVQCSDPARLVVSSIQVVILVSEIGRASGVKPVVRWAIHGIQTDQNAWIGDQ
jgi:hypothetical protein